MAEVVDKRAVHTDALYTLGSLIGPEEKRDAIHLAVEPVVAGEDLAPGEDVGRRSDGTFASSSHGVKLLGIVDPFIKGRVRKGQRFWLIVYPRQITSLHHVWEHPDFPAPMTPEVARRVELVSERLTKDSENWIRNEFVPNIAGPESTNYQEVMDGAKEWLDGEHITCLGDDLDYDFLGENIPKFWEHFRKITGRECPEDKRESFFRCAC